MKYRTIEGHRALWPANHRNWWQRLLYKLYKKYVPDPYIPSGTKIELEKEYQKGAPFYGEVKAIKLIKNNDTANEVHIYRQIFPDKEEWTV